LREFKERDEDGKWVKYYLAFSYHQIKKLYRDTTDDEIRAQIFDLVHHCPKCQLPVLFDDNFCRKCGYDIQRLLEENGLRH